MSMTPKGPPSRQQETESVLMQWLGHRVGLIPPLPPLPPLSLAPFELSPSELRLRIVDPVTPMPLFQ